MAARARAGAIENRCHVLTERDGAPCALASAFDAALAGSASVTARAAVCGVGPHVDAVGSAQHAAVRARTLAGLALGSSRAWFATRATIQNVRLGIDAACPALGKAAASVGAAPGKAHLFGAASRVASTAMRRIGLQIHACCTAGREHVWTGALSVTASRASRAAHPADAAVAWVRARVHAGAAADLAAVGAGTGAIHARHASRTRLVAAAAMLRVGGQRDALLPAAHLASCRRAHASNPVSNALGVSFVQRFLERHALPARGRRRELLVEQRLFRTARHH